MPISKNFILKTVGNENMIIPLTSESVNMSKVFYVNETAALIYKELLDEKTNDMVAKTISKEYEISFEEALEDVLAFVDELKKRGMYHD